MTFQHEGKKIAIRGDPSLTKTQVNLKNMMKYWGIEDQGFLIECRAMEGSLSIEEMYDEIMPTINESIPAPIK